MKTGLLPFVLIFAAATAAWAHSGVKNQAVKARMGGMSLIGDNLKIIGAMAKKQTPFDAEAAREAAAEIAKHASEVPELFEAPETDPKSEALSAIWQNYEDFTDKAEALERVALGLSTSLQDAEDLRPAMAAFGKTCKACHATYRE